VGLVGVPAADRDVGQGRTGAGEGHRAVEAQDATQRLRPVPERVQATAMQLPGAQPDLGGGGADRRRAATATPRRTPGPPVV
jgi:hypothetical protein